MLSIVEFLTGFSVVTAIIVLVITAVRGLR